MKTRFYVSLFMAMLSICIQSYAQYDYRQQYEYGKELIQQNRFQAAMQVLLPITSENAANPYTKCALYLYAHAAFKVSYFDDCKSALLQLLEKYPDWDNSDEALYLLSNVYFEQKQYRKALTYLKKLKGLTNDAENMKLHYLSKLSPIDSLIAIQKDYPEDILIAKLLAKKLALRTEDQKERMLLSFLIQEYKLDANKLFIKRKSVKKNLYRIAVLLPFNLKDTDHKSTSRTNQYVYDFYNGLKLAIDSLNAIEKNFTIVAYDTEKDINKVKSILNLKELASVDMIIGPIAQNEIELVSEFANKNEITLVLPFSANSKNIAGKEFVYLCQPSLEIIAGTVSRYVYDSLRVDSTYYNEQKNIPPLVKNHVMIFYSPEVRDSLLAARFRDSVLARGFIVKHFDKVTKTKVGFLQTIFADTNKLRTAACVFVASSDEVVAANIVSLLEVALSNTPIITRSEWLQFELISFKQMERRRVHFIHTDYFDYISSNYSMFKHKFLYKTNLYPSIHAIQGYDYMLYFGNALRKFGTYFYYGLQEEGETNNSILQGMSYKNSFSNTYVPLTRFREKKLEVINPLIAK